MKHVKKIRKSGKINFRPLIIVVLLLVTHLAVYEIGYYTRDTEVSTPQPTTTTGRQHVGLTTDNVLVKLNEERLNRSLTQLPVSPSLQEVAQKRADDIASGKTPFSHIGFIEGTQNGTFPSFIGGASEELTKAKTAPEAIKNFADSPTHADGLFNDRVLAVGIGVSNDVVVIILVNKQ